VRSEDFHARRRTRRDEGLTEKESAYNAEPARVSSRGVKYWSGGTIPLVAPDLLGGIIASAADIALVISDVGEILSVLVNPEHEAHEKLTHWEGRDIREVLTHESRAKIDRLLEAIGAGSDVAPAIEVNHAENGTWEFPIRYTFHHVGPDGALLMLGRDLRPVAEMQQQLVRAQLALERDYEAHREFDTRYRVLLETTREALVFVTASTGRIADINTAAAALFGAKRDELGGQPAETLFASDGARDADLLDRLTTAAMADGVASVPQIVARTGRSVSVHPSLFRAGGERMFLLRIEPQVSDELPIDELTENLTSFYNTGPEAIVFTDRDGVIQAANEAFLTLGDVALPALAKGKSLADFLVRGSVDLKVLIDNATRTGQMRLYATRILSAYGSQVAVEISATYLSDRAHPCVVFVMRDASRAESLRKSGANMSEAGVKSVMELVGSASLKDIVAETTDVVEKMCIETAVELTRNNRVAAAEMLGLSRQSLYVKLRKYGLINRRWS
jgi:transcriptional regulator PpsR